jgi:hypothetical protein
VKWCGSVNNRGRDSATEIVLAVGTDMSGDLREVGKSGTKACKQKEPGEGPMRVRSRIHTPQREYQRDERSCQILHEATLPLKKWKLPLKLQLLLYS